MLAVAIEKKRAQMIKIAKIHGLSSKQVLKCSQELDRLIDLYQSHKQKQYKSPSKRFVLFKPKHNRLNIQSLKKAQ
ncbi:MAG TPA: aspartyl-phosphate phosphatase Spo0E family protein [Bacillales bacterium]